MNIANRVAIAGLVAGIFFPVAKELERPVRETVTPAVLQKIVWAESNLGSFPQASTAFAVLAGIPLSPKRVRRMTVQIGQDQLDERRRHVAEFQEKPLAERVASPAGVASPEVGVVMMDGGRYQRRDHFLEDDYDGSHWKEDKVGIVLSLHSDVHENDSHPEFPAWLASADVVCEIASRGAREPEQKTAFLRLRINIPLRKKTRGSSGFLRNGFPAKSSPAANRERSRRHGC